MAHLVNQLGMLLILPAVLSSTSYKEPLVLGDNQGKFFLPEHPEDPEFAESETNVTAQLGGSVFLHCPVVNSGDRAVSYPTISWIRLRDWHILTNGMLTYTSDSRFQVLHKEGSYDWILQIKYVQERDAGEYECQVSTHTGIISRKVQVRVVTPEAFILGGDEYHIDRGSQISLVCVIEKAPSPPQYVFWYHNSRMVNYDTERGVTVQTSHGGTSVPARDEAGGRDGTGGKSSYTENTKSKFTIAEATPQDSGNYTCKPSNAMPASIQVFVSKNRVDKTEALHKQSSSLQQSGGKQSEESQSSSSLSSSAETLKGLLPTQWLFTNQTKAGLLLNCALVLLPQVLSSQTIWQLSVT